MTYLISTEVRGFKYYVKITYQGARYPIIRWEGLEDNATNFMTEQEANDMAILIQPRTSNSLVSNFNLRKNQS